MAIWWLDGARYGDSHGYDNDLENSQWPWRNWVIEAFNDNMPYDQFTVEQLAGDLLPNATGSQVLATGSTATIASIPRVGRSTRSGGRSTSSIACRRWAGLDGAHVELRPLSRS